MTLVQDLKSYQYFFFVFDLWFYTIFMFNLICEWEKKEFLSIDENRVKIPTTSSVVRTNNSNNTKQNENILQRIKAIYNF